MNFQLEYFLGSDWKFLACVCGIGAANGEHACIWCKCVQSMPDILHLFLRVSAYQEDDQPCLYKIIKHMQKFNKKWKLKPTPGKTEGVQISFKETLIDHAKRLKTSGVLEEGKTIKIKFSGDGTNIGKRLKVINNVYHFE